jgi:hypothetical protein
MLSLNDPRPNGQPRAKVLVMPIRPKRAQQPRKPEHPGDMSEKLDELRFELRCIEAAILALERLAIDRLPKPQHRLPESGRIVVSG